MAELGVLALSFSEFTGTPLVLAEGSLSGHATFQPSAPWSIGQPVTTPVDIGDLTFYYAKPNAPGDKFLGVIVPEPATLGLLGIGALAVLIRRRRR